MTDDVRNLDSAETTQFSAADETAAIDPDALELEDPDDTGEASDADSPEASGKRDLWRIKVNLRPVSIILVVLVMISGGIAAWLYVKTYRPDQQVDPAVARQAVSAASDGTVALLSYSPDTLDDDFAAAKSHLSGDFLAYYEQFTEQFVAPAAKQKALKTSAQVVRAAVSELHPGSAEVLLFVDQSTTSKDHPDPTMMPISVLASMAQIDGKWLITKFTPV
ncbi:MULTISPECIES: hypothetical protein [Mycobacterium]|uniref:Twin-arginine translocation pathway signal n=1 Tax=Mycobacterium pseudoshottsii TaxID=265949 RepID=A0A9N7QPA3_9MYCO|nr:MULTISPECIES: hypothetical protein [Mycobacterium]EPQ46534.1 hypothetical protein MMSP_2295 [Mycobacterium sp. 012931]BDN83705.1 hypothetical protein NJB1907Z4_C39200 [Mycobacterium pseudoshottsii]BEH78092.1 hypothetical protein YM3MPS_38950 [Mycobacterium pseudoshottsii]